MDKNDVFGFDVGWGNDVLPPSSTPELKKSGEVKKVEILYDFHYDVFNLRNTDDKTKVEHLYNEVMLGKCGIAKEETFFSPKTGEILLAVKYSWIKTVKKGNKEKEEEGNKEQKTEDNEVLDNEAVEK